MGAEQSVPSSMGFEALWASLPDDVQARVTALASKESDAILKPNPKAPGPLPPVPVGVTVRLDSEMARAALLIVPRLQRKHYELIPKQLDEMSFWVSPCPTLAAPLALVHCVRALLAATPTAVPDLAPDVTPSPDPRPNSDPGPHPDQVNFFSHMTVLVGPKHAEFLEVRAPPLTLTLTLTL